MLGAPQVEVGDTERDTFYHKLASGQISQADQSQMLQLITLPAFNGGGQYNFEPSFQKINTNHGRKILAFTGGFGFNNAAGMSSDHLRALLETYPTPIEFANPEAQMIDALIRSGNPEEKVKQYQADFEDFKQSVYGKRYEYAQALDMLKDQAIQATETRSQAEISPLEDSMAYWAPEAKAAYQDTEE